MSKNQSERMFRMGDDVLMQKADSVVESMQRDATDFLTRNVDAARTNEIVTINNDFKDFPTDQELLGLVTSATEIKDATALELRKQLSAVRSMATTKYGNTGKFKTFDFGELSALSNEDLFRTAKRVVRVGTGLLAELASEGLTAAMLANIATLATTLDTNIDDMQAAVEIRDIKTQQRVELANSLWNTLVKYADIGKSLYEFTDEARFNDYVLTDAAGGGETPVIPTT